MQWGIGGGRMGVQLVADQMNMAASLHERFGDAVELRLGIFPYPPVLGADDLKKEPAPVTRAKLPLLPNDEFDVGLENEMVVTSGATQRGVLRIRNRGRAEAIIQTNGGLTARVVDPQTEEGVGGFFGFQRVPLISFRIPSGGTVMVPLLVGTTSSVRILGYAVPPGQWAIEVPIQIEGRGEFRSSLLPILILPSIQNVGSTEP